MTLRACGLNLRQIETVLKTTFDKMKRDFPKEYANVLIMQGRAKDVGYFSDAERDMEAMCEAYTHIITRAVAKAIEENNKKLCKDIQEFKDTL